MKEEIQKALDSFMEFATDDKEVLAEFKKVLKTFFDDLKNDDYFGTEGQCYPFGDKRN